MFPEPIKEKEINAMKKQTTQFAVEKDENGIIKNIGKSVILQPKTNFKGGSVKWYEDKPKKKER